MFLEKIKAENFLSFRNLDLGFDNSRFFTIVGPNNSGKTNFVRALKLLKKACESPRIKADDFLRQGSRSSEFFLALKVSLSEEEKEDLRFFLRAWLCTQFELAKKGKRSRTILQNIKKNWNILLDEHIIIEKFLFQDFLENFVQVLKQFTIIVKYYYGKDLDYPTIKFSIDRETFPLTRNAIFYSKNCFSIIECLERFSEVERPEELTFKNFLKIIKKFEFGIEVKDFTQNDIKFRSSEERRRLDELLNKYSLKEDPHKHFTLLSFFLSILKTRIFFLDEIRNYPQEEFRDDEYKSLRQCSVYSGKGNDLSVFLFSLKSEKFERFNEIKNYFKEITGLDFDVEEKLEDDKWRVTLKFSNFNNKVSCHFVGLGLLEILNILAVCVGNKESVIVLDEPALHLHPTKQKQIIEKLFEFKEADQNQIFLITHSPYMVLKEALRRTYYFSLKNRETKVICLDQILDQIEEGFGKEKVIREFEFYPYREMLFADSIIFVEGESEAIGIPFILKDLFEQKNILIFNVRSMTHFEIPTKVAKSLDIPFVAVGDAQAENELRTYCPNSYFTLRQNDFIDFLRDCFQRTFQEYGGRKKTETTISVLSNADPEELENAKRELEPLVRLMEERFNIKGNNRYCTGALDCS